MEVDSDDCNHKREYFCEICVLDFTTQHVSMHVAYLAFMLFFIFKTASRISSRESHGLYSDELPSL